jgi:hypothetical protein
MGSLKSSRFALLALSMVLLATVGSQASGAPYSCGPILLQPGPHRMVVVIDHEAPLDATLWYQPAGEKPGAGIDRATATEIRQESPQRHHIFELTGLAAGTTYAYEISSRNGVTSGVHTFGTLPERPDRYRLVVMGDVRSQPEVWRRMASRILTHERSALFMIGTGDYPADGRDYSQWVEQFFAPGRELLAEMPLWPAIGNHERTRSSDGRSDVRESHYFGLFELPGNERWFRVDYQYVTILILDSNSPMTPHAPQCAWLREQLAEPRHRFTIVVLHHAPVSSGPHGQTDQAGRPREWPIAQSREYLLPLFEERGVDLVLTGHDHIYERSVRNGVVYVVTGGAGAPLYEINAIANPDQVVAVRAHHYVTLDIGPEAIDLQAFDIDGRRIDTARIEVSVASPEPAPEPARPTGSP